MEIKEDENKNLVWFKKVEVDEKNKDDFDIIGESYKTDVKGDFNSEEVNKFVELYIWELTIFEFVDINVFDDGKDVIIFFGIVVPNNIDDDLVNREDLFSIFKFELFIIIVDRNEVVDIEKEVVMIEVDDNNDDGIVELNFLIDVDDINDDSIVELNFLIDVDDIKDESIVELNFLIDVDDINDDGIVEISFLKDVDDINDDGIVEISFLKDVDDINDDGIVEINFLIDVDDINDDNSSISS